MSGRGFFDGYRQEAVSIRGFPGRSPMFFRDLSLMGGVFLADLSRVRAVLPGRSWRPLSLPLGRALVAVHCMEYRDSDVGPYNEVSLSIGLRRGRLPPGSMLQAAGALLSARYHAYVRSLPVTTEVAVHGGLDFFNYPKYLADISFRDTASHRVCTLRDKDSRDLILEFTGRRLATRSPAPDERDLLAFTTYPEIGGRPHRAGLLVDQRERGAALLRGAELRLGPSPRAEAFRSLGLGRLVHYLYVPRAQAVMSAPEPL